MSNTQLKQFKALLAASDYGFEDTEGLMAEIEGAFLKATETQQKPAAETKSSQTSKKKSGYNLFMSENMGKQGGMDMDEAVKAYKALSVDQKAEWKLKASKVNSENPTEVVKKPRKKSGYNLFMSHQMKEKGLKMADASKAWKLLEQKDKDVWNSKAKAL